MPATASEIVRGLGKPEPLEKKVSRRAIARSGSLVLYDLPWTGGRTLPESIVLVPLPPRQAMSRRPPPWFKRVTAEDHFAKRT